MPDIVSEIHPLVTVVCTCYNQGKYVTKSLNSVLRQTYKNIELIIVDDYSTDNSVDIIKQWISQKKIGTLIQNKSNLGLTKSFNNAFKKIKGEYFVDLAADDVLLPDSIETQISIFNSYKKDPIAIVYGNAKVIDKINKNEYLFFDRFPQTKKTTNPKHGCVYKELINHANTVCSVSAMTKSSVFKKLGGYDEQLIYEDYDFWIRAARNHHIIFIDKILVERIKLKNSLGNTNYKIFGNNTLKFKYSTYLTVKKTLRLNQSKDEDKASIDKIKLEIKENLKMFNLPLFVRYLILMFKFKKSKRKIFDTI